MPSPRRSPRQPNLEITRHRERRHEVLALYGELDSATCEDLIAVVRDAWQHGQAVVLDLVGVTFIDSSGVRCLTTLHTEAPDDRVLEMIAPRRHVQRVLEVAGVAQMFTYRTAPEPGG